MLDLTSMTDEQRQSLLHIFEVTADNPLEELKMNFLLAALSFKEWVEKNAVVNKQQLNIMWTGLESAVNRHFHQAQKQIAQKTGIKFIER